MTDYQRITVAPIAGALGAEIGGVDLADVDDETVAEIRDAWLAHLVVFFRDQSSTATSSSRSPSGSASRSVPVRAGASTATPTSSRSPSSRTRRVNFGGIWHSDTTYLDEPPMATMLLRARCRRSVATRCSPTCTPRTTRCRPRMRELLEPLRAVEQLGARRREQDARGPHPRRRATPTTYGVRGRRTRSCARTRRPAARRSTSTSRTPPVRRDDRGGEPAAPAVPLPAPGASPSSPAGSGGRSARWPCGTTAAPSTTRSTTTTASRA